MFLRLYHAVRRFCADHLSFRDPDERYLSQSTDHADLKRRLDNIMFDQPRT